MSGDVPKIRALFDCMIFLQGAARRESAAGACLALVELGAFELCVSREILAEVRDVLARPQIRHRFPALTGRRCPAFHRGARRTGDRFSRGPTGIPL